MEPSRTLDDNGIVKENSKKKCGFKVKLLKSHLKMMMNLAVQNLT